MDEIEERECGVLALMHAKAAFECLLKLQKVEPEEAVALALVLMLEEWVEIEE